MVTKLDRLKQIYDSKRGGKLGEGARGDSKSRNSQGVGPSARETPAHCFLPSCGAHGEREVSQNASDREGRHNAHPEPARMVWHARPDYQERDAKQS